jgi:hypothetical protein
MDLSPILNEFDTPFLVDSGTESFTESPVAEEESEHSEDSTVCDIDSSNSIQKCNVQLHILDKDVSVDEDILAVPLEPIRTHTITKPCSVATTCQQDEGSGEPNYNELLLPSILRRESSNSTIVRKVSFPTAETELATYREPEYDYPWTINTYLSSEKILQIYQASCKQHKTIELDIIKNLIMVKE